MEKSKETREPQDCTDYQLSCKQLEEITKAFRYLDSDKDGRIPTTQLPSLFKFLGQNPTSQDEKRMEDQIPPGGYSQSLDIDQVVAVVKHVGLKCREEVLEELVMAFRAIDADGDGCITCQELETYMRRVGEPMSRDEVQEMIGLADENGDGVVDWHEFANKLCEHIM